MRLNLWTFSRTCFVLSYLLAFVSVTIADYGYDYSLWENASADPVGWWHEICLLTLGLIVAIDLTYWWQYGGRQNVRVFIVRSDKLGPDPSSRKQE